MSDTKIKVPEGMLEAAFAALGDGEKKGSPPAYGAFLEAALLWQRNNAPMPTESQIGEMIEAHRRDVNLWNRFGSGDSYAYHCWAWIRRMYDAPEIEPSPDLIGIANKLMANPNWRSTDLYYALLEAFRCGEKAASK